MGVVPVDLLVPWVVLVDLLVGLVGPRDLWVVPVDLLVPWGDPVGLAALEEEVSWMPLEAAQVVLVDHLVQWVVLVGLVGLQVLWVVLVDLLVGLVGHRDLWVVPVDHLVPWVDPVGLVVLDEEVSWMPLEVVQAVLVDLLVPWVVPVDLLVQWAVPVNLLDPWVVLVNLLVGLVDHPVPWVALVAPVVQEEEVSWMPSAGVDLVREGFPLNTFCMYTCMYTLQAEDYTNQISNEENK